MKYSFLIPYHKRPSLRDTLESFKSLYHRRNDFEIIVVESIFTQEDKQAHRELIEIISSAPFPEKHLLNSRRTGCPSSSYNLAFSQSSGDILIITNPESPHVTDVLSGFDVIFEKDLLAYVVCACKAVKRNGDFIEWYQHSVFNNKQLHFCSAISRKGWLRVNGFCEAYSKGVAYGDDDFLNRVKMSGLNIVTRDDLQVLHIEHAPATVDKELWKINRNLYNFIWA